MTQKPIWQKQIAKERIEILFSEAEKVFKSNPKRAAEHIKAAHKIAMRYRVHLGGGLKRKFCKKCFSYLKPGVTSTIRLNKSMLITTCKNCGAVKRLPYKPKNKA